MQQQSYAVLFLLMFAAAIAHAEPPLKLQIVELPPYMIVDSSNHVSGLAVDPTFNALKKAGVDFDWELVQAAHQMGDRREFFSTSHDVSPKQDASEIFRRL